MQDAPRYLLNEGHFLRWRRRPSQCCIQCIREGAQSEVRAGEFAFAPFAYAAAYGLF